MRQMSEPEAFSQLMQLGEAGRAPRRAHYQPLREPLTEEQLHGSFPEIWRVVRLSLRDELDLDLDKSPPELDDIETDEAATLIGFCTIQSLAYGTRRGDVDAAKRRARAILDAMGECRAWVPSTLYTCIEPETLSLRASSYGYGASHIFGMATFEQVVLLVSRTHVALLMWEDED